MDKSNNNYWLNKVPWYKTAIYSRLHVSLFEYFITHARTNRQNLLCSIVAHDYKQPDNEDDGISIGDRLIHKNVITEALEEMGATLNFIEIWLKLLDKNYGARRVAYITSMKEMFKQIPTTMTRPLSPRQKVHKLMTEIDDGRCIEKITKGIPPLRRPKLSKKHKIRKM